MTSSSETKIITKSTAEAIHMSPAQVKTGERVELADAGIGVRAEDEPAHHVAILEGDDQDDDRRQEGEALEEEREGVGAVELQRSR